MMKQVPGSRLRVPARRAAVSPLRAPRSARRVPRPAPRAGFTMVALLVVVAIMAILVTLTFSAYTLTADADRVRSGARQLQSYLEGARDRAIYAREPRGVRFLLDPETPGQGIPQTVSSMVFIGAPGKYRTGKIQLDNSTTPPTVVHALDTNWQSLIARGLLSTTPRIKVIINASTSEYLHMARENAGTGNWRLSKAPTVAYTPLTDYDYELELLPAVLPNQEPRLLAKEIVIDLGKSALPPAWGTVNNYSNTMDVMFSPRGTIIGDVASTGLVHFFLADNIDVKQGRGGQVVNVTVNGTTSIDVELDPTVDLASVATGVGAQYRAVLINGTGHVHVMSFISSIAGQIITLPYDANVEALLTAYPPVACRVELLPERKAGDERIVTLTPQTGNISTSEVDENDTFSLARTGAVAK